MTRFRALTLFVLFLSVASFVVNKRHHTTIFGGGDEGSYIGSGKLFSQQFTFIFDDPVLKSGSQYGPMELFVPPSFRIRDRESDPPTVRTGWNKGFAIVSTPFWWLDPEGGWRYVSPLAGALSLVLLFLIGARLRGPYVGAYAALLLATNALQIWHCRYPMTEVLSQCLQLSLLLLTVLYYQEASRRALAVFAVLGSLSLVVHFGNAPTVVLLGAFLTVQRFRRTPREAVTTAIATVLIPAGAAVAYWFLDPGVQRYKRFGKVMVRNTGERVDRFFEAVAVRLQSLITFLPTGVMVLIVLGIAFSLLRKKIDRRLWLLFMVLMGATFLVIAAGGIGVPRAMYIGRRLLPVLLPVLLLFAAIGLDLFVRESQGGAPQWQRSWRRAVASGVCLLLAGYQLSLFWPLRNLNPGAGFPELSQSVQRELRAREDGRPQFVLVTSHDIARHMKEGLRYIYGVPVLNFTKKFPRETVERMLKENVQLYVLEVLGSRGSMKAVNSVSEFPQTELTLLTTGVVQWGHPNSKGVSEFPTVTDRVNYRFGLYQVSSHAPVPAIASSPAAPPEAAKGGESVAGEAGK